MNDQEQTTRVVLSDCDVEVQHVRRDRWVARARVAIALVAIGGLPWLLGVLGLSSFAVIGGLVALLAYFWSAVALAGTDRGIGERRLGTANVELDDEELTVTADKAFTALPLGKLDGGWTERTPKEHRAVLSFSDGRVVAVAFPSEKKAQAFLSAAGAGAAARAVRMRGYREDPAGRKIAGFFLAFFGLPFVPVLVSLPVLLFAAIQAGSTKQLAIFGWMSLGSAPLLLTLRWLWRKVRPTWIEIGADGVRLQGAFRKHFFAHADIVEAKPVTTMGVSLDRSVEITLKSGKKHLFPAGDEAEVEVVCERIIAARDATSGQERARLLDVLARAGRPLSVWREALTSLVTKSGYRAATHDLEEVMRVVEDVTAPLEQRVAAALAARPHGGEPVQQRIRVAAEACVEPRVRIALEKASEGALDDEALAEVAEEEARVVKERRASD